MPEPRASWSLPPPCCSRSSGGKRKRNCPPRTRFAGAAAEIICNYLTHSRGYEVPRRHFPRQRAHPLRASASMKIPPGSQRAAALWRLFSIFLFAEKYGLRRESKPGSAGRRGRRPLQGGATGRRCDEKGCRDEGIAAHGFRRCGRAEKASEYYSSLPWQSLYFMGSPLGRSLPQGQGSLRPGFFARFTGCFFRDTSPPILFTEVFATLLRCTS